MLARLVALHFTILLHFTIQS